MLKIKQQPRAKEKSQLLVHLIRTTTSRTCSGLFLSTRRAKEVAKRNFNVCNETEVVAPCPTTTTTEQLVDEGLQLPHLEEAFTYSIDSINSVVPQCIQVVSLDYIRNNNKRIRTYPPFLSPSFLSSLTSKLIKLRQREVKTTLKQLNSSIEQLQNEA